MSDTHGEMISWTTGKVKFTMFPPGYIALNKELASGRHTRLAELLAAHPADEVDIKLAEIAAYCGIVLDGNYTIIERDKLCSILAGRLEVLRDLPH